MGATGRIETNRVPPRLSMIVGTDHAVVRAVVHDPRVDGDYSSMEGSPDTELRALLSEGLRIHGEKVDAAWWAGFGGFTGIEGAQDTGFLPPHGHESYRMYRGVKVVTLMDSRFWPTFVWSADGEVVAYASLDIPVTVIASRSASDPLWECLAGRTIVVDPNSTEPELLRLVPGHTPR